MSESQASVTVDVTALVTRSSETGCDAYSELAELVSLDGLEIGEPENGGDNVMLLTVRAPYTRLTKFVTEWCVAWDLTEGQREDLFVEIEIEG